MAEKPVKDWSHHENRTTAIKVRRRKAAARAKVARRRNR